ncbi:hypothetical protein CsatB_015394 [Cannabis sativa]
MGSPNCIIILALLVVFLSIILSLDVAIAARHLLQENPINLPAMPIPVTIPSVPGILIFPFATPSSALTPQSSPSP